jgi:hypothetical protein
MINDVFGNAVPFFVVDAVAVNVACNTVAITGTEEWSASESLMIHSCHHLNDPSEGRPGQSLGF